MQTLVAGGYRWKTKDLERLPEEPFLSYEIIDGELIVARKPHLRHAAVIGTLCAQIHPAVRALHGVLLVEPGIVWSEEAEDNVAPDLAIVLPDRLHLASGRALSGTPNIVMEVVSEGSVEVDLSRSACSMPAPVRRSIGLSIGCGSWLRSGHSQNRPRGLSHTAPSRASPHHFSPTYRSPLRNYSVEPTRRQTLAEE